MLQVLVRSAAMTGDEAVSHKGGGTDIAVRSSADRVAQAAVEAHEPDSLRQRQQLPGLVGLAKDRQ